QLKLGVLDAKLAQNLVARLAHYASTRIVVFVNTVAKAHQFEGIIFIFCFSNEFFNVGNIANFIKHFKYGFVGSTVSRTPERGNTSSNSCIRVGARRTSHAHSRGGSVLLVVCMQNKDAMHGLCYHRRYLVIAARTTKKHRTEVLTVRQLHV